MQFQSQKKHHKPSNARQSTYNDFKVTFCPFLIMLAGEYRARVVPHHVRHQVQKPLHLDIPQIRFNPSIVIFGPVGPVYRMLSRTLRGEYQLVTVPESRRHGFQRAEKFTQISPLRSGALLANHDEIHPGRVLAARHFPTSDRY